MQRRGGPWLSSHGRCSTTFRYPPRHTARPSLIRGTGFRIPEKIQNGRLIGLCQKYSRFSEGLRILKSNSFHQIRNDTQWHLGCNSSPRDCPPLEIDILSTEGKPRMKCKTAT